MIFKWFQWCLAKIQKKVKAKKKGIMWKRKLERDIFIMHLNVAFSLINAGPERSPATLGILSEINAAL